MGRLTRFFFGDRLGVLRDPLRFYWEMYERRGDIAVLQDLWRPFRRRGTWLFISHPREIAHVLQENHRNYVKGALNTPFTEMLGEGLLTSDGDLWHSQRRLLTPAFGGDARAAAAPAIRDAVSALVSRWKQQCNGPMWVDLWQEMSRLTMDVVCRVFLGVEITVIEADDLCGDMHLALAYVTRRSFELFPSSARLRIQSRLEFQAALRRVDLFVERVVRGRRQQRPAHLPGLLFRLLPRQGEPIDASMSDAQLRDEIVTILHAGQNTLASALTWTLVFVSRSPEVANALRDEAMRGDELYTNVQKAAQSVACRSLMEALRLYPPAWGGVREAVAPDVFRGARVEPGTPIVFSQYVTQRRPDLWEDPDRFKPERFLPDAVHRQVPYSYFPFGGGPHRCIGEHFAVDAGTLILLSLARAVRIDVSPAYAAEPRILLDMEPAHPVPANVTAS